ncbi:hypothetical protein ID866_10927 [Astraeus odoratus]|nr:hypothetical protein ID866_10927 [Astraeus odoratus]
MSTSNKNVKSVNWQEVPNAELGWDEADPEDIDLAKLQEKYWHKQVWEAEEVKKCWEAEEAEKRASAVVRQREAEQQREAERQEAKRAKEAKKQQHTKSKARPSEKCEWPVTEIRSVCRVTSPWGGEKKKRLRKVWTVDNNEVMVVSACKAGKSEPRARETMVQVVDRRMGEVMAELQGLRKGMSDMAEANWDLTQVLYQGFQSVNMLVDKVKIFRAEGVEELQEECLEWAMEHLQMRKEWMRQEEAALTKHLKGKGKELAKEKEQEGEEQEEQEQGAGGEGEEGVAA